MILITGASGFVGGSLLRYFAARGLAVTGTCRQGSSTLRGCNYGEDEIAALVAEIEPSLIIHAAGSASVAASLANPAEDFAAQVSLFQRLLEGVRRSGAAPRVLFLSSAAVYGNPVVLPVAENAPLQPISPYGHHKMIAESLAREYSECFAIPTLVARLFSLFGPAQRRLLLWELVEQFQHRSEVVVEGTGKEARDYIYIDDLAEALLRLVAKVKETTLTVNVASGRSVTVSELVTKIQGILGSEKSASFRGRTMPGNPARWQADVSLFERIVGSPAAGDFDQRLASIVRSWQ